MRRTAAVLAVLGLLFGLVSFGAVAAASPQATLIDVHVFRGAARATTSANCSNDGATSAGEYSLTGWTVSGPRTAYLNTASVPAGLGTVTDELQASFDQWSNQSGAPAITVATGSTVKRPTADRTYELMWGRTSGSAIAVTYTWRWSDGAIESDTIFNVRLPWFTAAAEGDGCDETTAKYDVRDIATHEFGHTYGMGHPSGGRFETMYAYGFTGETLKWSLGTGDTTGIRVLYGN